LLVGNVRLIPVQTPMIKQCWKSTTSCICAKQCCGITLIGALRFFAGNAMSFDKDVWSAPMPAWLKTGI